MASFSVPKCIPFASLPNQSHKQSLASFPKRTNQKLPLVPRLQAKLNEVVVKESSNSLPASASSKCEPSEQASSQSAIADASSIDAFMTQVSDLVKLVDSRDIVELELKQLGCELLIRKKEAITQPQPPATMMAMQPTYHHNVISSPPPPTQIAAPPPQSPKPAASAPSLPAPAKASSSSHPAFKCPMAGTFYRSPGPGEPPFVKVGDKVQKGQVICIVEAMKLMNEIEADQAGTVAEVLAEDGKPVSVDTPLFVIVP